MKKYIGPSLALVLAGCAADKGTAINYIELLGNKPCQPEFNLSQFSTFTLSTKTNLLIGDGDQCIESKQGKSFYKVIKSEQAFTKVHIRSFFSLRKNKTNMFLPIASIVDSKNGKVVNGIVDEISDDNNFSDGYFLITNYSFSTPVNSVVIHTDPSNYDYSYQMVSKGSVTLSSGNAFIPVDFTSSRNFTYNAGGSIEVTLLQ